MAEFNQPGMTEEKTSKASKWLWLLPVIIAAVAVIAVALLWFGNQRLKQTKEATPTPSSTIETEAGSVEKQSSSDEVSAIETDLQETDLTDLDQELTEIEAELATP